MPEPVLEGQDTYPEPGVWTTIVGRRSTFYLQRGQTITVRWSSFWEAMTELGYTRPVDDGEFPDVDSRFPDVAEVMRMIAVGATTLPGQRILDVRGTTTGLVVTVGTDMENSREHAVAWPVMTELIDHVTQLRDEVEGYATDAGGALDTAVLDLRTELAQLNGIASAAAQIALDAAESISTGDAAQGLSAYEVAVKNGFTGSEVEWLASLQGLQGEQGDPGERGPQGLSAYEVAIDNGFTGTQTAWLASLQGEKGDPGDQGVPGPRGEAGQSVTITGQVPTAADLPTGLGLEDNGKGWVTQNDGHLHVWDGTAFTDVGPVRGPAGDQGEPGQPGDQGPEGASAYEVAVANGFPGTEQQWLDSLQGEKGDQGQPGDPGQQGDPGPAGASAYQVAVANGFSGTQAQWLASLEGEKGDPGDQGIQGVPGQPGQPGDTGPQGSSAYQVAVANGFVGTEQQWLASLKGDPGQPGTTTWDGIEDKPSTFNPATHTHTTGQVSGLEAILSSLQTALDGKMFKVVTALPSSPNSSTVYFVTG